MKWFRVTGWLKIILYLGLTVVLSCLLAPWLFHLGKEIVRQGWLADGPAPIAYLHGALERSPFSRYFNRAVMIVALIGLIILVPAMLRGWRDLGISKNPCAVIDVTAGVLLAAGFLLFMGAGFLYMGFFVPEAETNWGVIPKLICTAIAVGLIEEVFFRGAILGVCLRTMKKSSAVLLTSILYAIPHFLKPPRADIPQSQVNWATGFDMLGPVLKRFMDLHLVVADFLTLLALGIVLAVARIRTHSLWLPIGLHAGWVFAYQLYNKNTDASDSIANWAPWVGSDLKVGLIPLIVIAITGALASLWVDLSRRPTIEIIDSPDEGE